MKKNIIFLFAVLMVTICFAQETKDVTKFMGIPVDGSTSNMAQKLKDKGFTCYNLGEGIFKGEFNGEEVRIYIVTNNNKVYRIAIFDETNRNEEQIKIRFNKLYWQFRNNKKYVESPRHDGAIPENEDISYEMSIHNKSYDALFYQLSEIGPDYNRTVWFKIFKQLGMYYIGIFYDNEYNAAHGEDL